MRQNSPATGYLKLDIGLKAKSAPRNSTVATGYLKLDISKKKTDAA